jgi:hypothetical protein
MNNSMFDLPKRAKAMRRDAELAEGNSALEWRKAEKEKLATSGLTGGELRAAELALMHEFGRRLNKGLRRAKRQTTLPKLMERQAMAEIEAERKASEK